MSSNISTYREWSKTYTAKTKIKELSQTFPVSASTDVGRVEIKFQEPYGKSIRFQLTKEDALMLHRHLTEALSKLNSTK